MTEAEVPKKKRQYIVEPATAKGFNKAFTLKLAELQKESLAQFMNLDNAQRVRHGGEFQSPANPQAVESGLKQHTATLETKFDDVVNNKLGLITRSLESVSEQMQKQFAEMFYATLSDACEQTGNVVDAQAEGSHQEAFAAILEKIELVADREGNVEMPQMHVSPETGDRLIESFREVSPEYEARVNAIKARKIAEAVQREVERKAKFVGYGL